MKILFAPQIKEADAYSIANEPINSIDLMERASMAWVQWFIQHHKLPFNKRILIFCGQGNNGGDGLCIGRILMSKGYKVACYVIKNTANSSSDFICNLSRFQKFYPSKLYSIKAETDFPIFEKSAIIIDAIFGSGINKPVQSLTAKLIKYLNSLNAYILSVDVPSGLYTEAYTPIHQAIIKATYTVTFEFPKLAFMLACNYPFVGSWHVVKIGLSKNYTQKVSCAHYYLSAPMVNKKIKKINKFAHKGTNGHVLVFGGSYGKIGATYLCAKASQKIGAGLVSMCIPNCGYATAQTLAPECMTLCLPANKNYLIHIPQELSIYKSIAVGVGMGTHPKTQQALLQLLQNYSKPLVIDADALNCIALNNSLSLIPAYSIITPHIKEFERLVGKCQNDFERLKKQQQLAQQYNIFVVLKGAHTCIACPNGICYFNSTGNSGMATGGSGDILTGIIAGLLAMGYTSKNAAILGVFYHGIAGNKALGKKQSITALDILQQVSLPKFDN